MLESPRYGAGVGIAFAEPTRSVAKAAIEATEASRIKFLQLSLVLISKTLASLALFRRLSESQNLTNLADILVYKTSTMIRERHCDTESASTSALLRRDTDLKQPIGDRVDQRLERGVDDVAGHPDRRPGVAVSIAELDQNARHRIRAALEDAQFEVLDIFLVDAEVLAQRKIERVDRAVALGCGNEPLLADADLHHRLRSRIGDARRDHLALDADMKAVDREIFWYAAEHAARQKLERGVGGFISEALRLARLDLV